MDKIIAIDIGGTNLRIGTVYKNLKVENFYKTSSYFLREEGSHVELVKLIKNYIEEQKLTDITAISIGIPSMVSKDRKFVFRAPNLKGLVNINLADYLQGELNLKVALDRDVNYLLIHDIDKYGLDEKKEKTILGFYIGTGLGNPVYINGKIYRGKNGVAGELAHTPIRGLEEVCPCGNVGCVEIVASGKALENIREEHFKDTPFEEIFTRHSNTDEIKEFITLLSYPLATEITVLDPDLIVLSSGVISMKDFPRQMLIEEIKKRTKHPYPAENLEYIFTENSHENGVIGGAISLFNGF
ncbi:allose kinase [Anaerosphaera aminiphila DSM 21120]|uniref:Allose kinase n=1 Tax=Anaerosphaera aminiphila DSM 21120 TaxID=1120995 RepID=A0A1M5TRY1_9FIRM|nr:allose kinase [Anaerosphaera aminiphila]SHH53441.1 allose kinase [Anaerosphaera aminiphila DSM 21120]